MRLALVHDSLCGTGGAEKVFQSIAKGFPSADIFTFAYRPKLVDPYFQTRNIYTSMLNGVAGDMSLVRWLYPISTFAMQFLDLSSYDLIISSSTTVAKHVHARSVPHLCYCYYPPRALWDTDQYFTQDTLKSFFLRLFLPILRSRDLSAFKRITHVVTQSLPAQTRIKQIYGVAPPIIPGPIATPNISASQLLQPRQSFLIVSRLEEWKQLEHAIEAFNILRKPLNIVGSGSFSRYLQSLNTSPFTRFLGWQSESQLQQLYLSSQALIFTPDLEYGITPLEALHYGCPVIAFDSPGVRFTLLPYSTSIPSQNYTSIHYSSQSSLSLLSAIKLFSQVSFDPIFLNRYAARFSEESFLASLKSVVYSLV